MTGREVGLGAARSPSVRIGDSLDDVETPALIVELDALERNVAAMAAAVDGRGVRLRPHAKSHKCPDIARRQIAAGAIGVCCQKVGEAEIFVAAGVGDVLITNEIVGATKLERLAALACKAKLGVLVDDLGNVRSLGSAMRAAGASIDVLIEVDVGAHRCGVLPGAPALALARAVDGEDGLRFAGLQAYQGAAQHLRRPAERRAAIARATESAVGTKALIERAGIRCGTVTGAGTGTFPLERDSGVYTELQPGSYIFMDADYGRNERDPDDVQFEQSLFVWTTVMSTPAPDRAIVDAGLKAFAVDSGMPMVADAASWSRHRTSTASCKYPPAAPVRRSAPGSSWCPAIAIRRSICMTGSLPFATIASRDSGRSPPAAR